MLSDELWEWGLEGWDWQIQQISTSDFGVVFPSKESLRMVSTCTSFILPRNQLVISVTEAVDGGKSSASLSDVWVLLDGMPAVMRNSPSLMDFAELIGKPVMVDESSLARLGPVHMQISCIDPSRVHGFVEIFPTSSAFRISVRVEGAPGTEANFPPPPPPPVSRDDDPSKDDDTRNDSLNG